MGELGPLYDTGAGMFAPDEVIEFPDTPDDTDQKWITGGLLDEDETDSLNLKNNRKDILVEPMEFEERKKIDDVKDIIFKICRKSHLSREVSSKMANTFHYPLIASLIAVSTSLAFLGALVGTTGFSYLAIKRIDELREKELKENPHKKKQINAKYKKILKK